MEELELGAIWINDSNGIGYKVESETVIITDKQYDGVVLTDLSDGSSLTITVFQLKNDFIKKGKLNLDEIPFGLYKLHWWSGGVSLASIGYLRDGAKTISVTNWTNGHNLLSEVADSIKTFEPVLLNQDIK